MISNIFVSIDENSTNINLKSRILESKKKFVSKHGDFMSLYKIFVEAEKAKENKKLDDFCRKHFLKMKTIAKMFDEYRKIRFGSADIMKSNRNTRQQFELSSKEIKNRIMQSINHGYKNNQGTKTKDGNYKIKYVHSDVKIGQDSFVNLLQSKPKNICYHEYSVITEVGKIGMIGII
jgi:HrpA-like RNA helicase